MTNYVRLTKGLSDKGKLVPDGDIYNHLETNDTDYYRSVYLYNQDQYYTFQQTGSVAGVTDVFTNKVVFDFDDEANPDQSQADCLKMVSRLLSQGLNRDDFNVYFSGNKGFSIEFQTTHSLTPKELRSLAEDLAKDLPTFDTKVYNASRIFRVPFTKHNKTGLYKVPVNINQLSELTVDQIKDLASNLDNFELTESTSMVSLPDTLIKAAKSEKKKTEVVDDVVLSDLDFAQKPKRMPACKFAILHGHFKPGSRNHALMALAAHYKAEGVPREVTVRILEGSAELQARRYKQDPYELEKIEKEIIGTVYGMNWLGRTYACSEHSFLKEICEQTGRHRCSYAKNTAIVRIESVADSFAKYAADIDKNTVKTGIECIDKQIRLQTCSHVVLAGCSGSGKTTLTLNILNNLSKSGLYGLFGSMDMNSNLIYQKLAHRVSGLNDKQLYDLYKANDKQAINDIGDKITKEFNNILFDFRSGVSFEELRENILETKNKVGNNMKLVVLDFINRIRGPYSDETANLSYIAPKLSDLANESETLIISLAQIARHKGGPSTPLTDSRVAKGSSAIEESATVLFGIWRPGYNQGINDKYMSMAALKTRMGKEFNENLYFNGLTSEIRDLTPDEQKQYEHFIDSQKPDEDEKKGYGKDW